MWNLTGDDIQQAKQQLQDRRAAIQDQYDRDIREVEAKLADIETVERVAIEFVSSFKRQGKPEAAAGEPNVAPEQPFDEGAEPKTDDADHTEHTSAGGLGNGEARGSRWRMRLGNPQGGEIEAA